jgi:hypothetical protein
VLLNQEKNSSGKIKLLENRELCTMASCIGTKEFSKIIESVSYTSCHFLLSKLSVFLYRFSLILKQHIQNTKFYFNFELHVHQCRI